MLTIPADVYDYHELISEAFGGIGRDRFYDCYGNPCCILGQRRFIDNFWHFARYDVSAPQELYCPVANDAVIQFAEQRIPWLEYCARRGIVRGE